MIPAKTFTYNKPNQRKIAFLFLVLAIAGAALALYMWLWADRLLLTVLTGGVFLFVLGTIIFIKLIVAPKKEDEPSLTISGEGIIGITAPVARAAGLIEWDDIEHIRVYTRMLEIGLRNPQKYAGRMSCFFVRDTFLKASKGCIRVPFAQTNATAAELLDILESHTQQRATRIL